MYVITGATGNTGKVITENLLNAGQKVRIISRSREKAKELVDKGAELFVGDTSNVGFLSEAFVGTKAVYAMVPMDWVAEDHTAFQVKHATAIAEALKNAKVKYAVSLSSQGAHMVNESGVVLGLHKMEQMFNAIEGLNVLHLRPTYFMENTLGMIGLVKQSGIMGSPVNADYKFPIIATKDIANYASKRLLSLDFTGQNVQDLLGARDVTYSEIAKVYGAALKRPDLTYVEFSYDDFKSTMVKQMGASVSVADNFEAFIKAFNAGKITEKSKRNAESTTPTSIDDFARVFSFIYNS